MKDLEEWILSETERNMKKEGLKQVIKESF